MTSSPKQLREQPGLIRRTVRFFGRLLLLASFLSAVLVAGWFYAMHRADQEIRIFVEQKLAEHYPHFQVKVGSAQLIQNQGIEIHNISIRQVNEGSSPSVVAQIGQIFITCNASLPELITGSLKVHHVSVHGLKIIATRQADGSINAQQLFPLPKFGDHCPLVKIGDGVVQWIDHSNNSKKSFTLRNLNLTLDPKFLPLDPTSNLQQTSDNKQLDMIHIYGAFSGDHFNRMTIDCSLKPNDRQWSANGTIQQLQISPQLIAALPGKWSKLFAAAKGLRGTMDLKYKIGQPNQGEFLPRFEITGELSQGQLTDRRLPAPLTDIHATLTCNNDEFRILQMTARGGLGQLELSYHQQGLSPGSPFLLNASTQQLVLDSRLAQVLPADMRIAWDKFSPVGLIDAQLNLNFDGKQWVPDLKVQCQDVSFSYYKFPYRVSSGAGTIHYKDNSVDLRLRTLASGQIVKIEGNIKNPGPDATGKLSIELLGPIPLDERLLSALDAKSQKVVRSLRPRGMIVASAEFERLDPSVLKADTYIKIDLHDCAINYEKFPYPLSRIRGTLEMTNGQWAFHDLEGVNDSGYVTCQGGWTSGDDQSGELALDFVATDVPLEDELRHALPQEVQRIWTDLRPRGTIDHLKIGLRYNNDSKKTKLTVQAQKRNQKQNVEGRTITVHPKWFPYRLDNVTGTFFLHDNQVDLTNIAAVHGRTGITLNGECHFQPDGSWKILLNKLTADRLQLDHDLVAALPGNLSNAVAKLHLTGPLSMQGSFQLASRNPQSPIQSDWDLSFDVENGTLDCSILLKHIHGGLRLVGSHGAAGSGTRGEITIDSMLYHDVQFTKVSGPLWIDSQGVSFGSWARRAGQSGPPRHISANVFGGNLNLDARVSSGNNSQFILHTDLSGANLRQIAQDLSPSSNQKVSGKANAVLDLRGVNRQPHTLRGGGIIRIYDADIYELPVMLSMLKILTIRRPDSAAFTTSDIDFDVLGENITFRRINFNGDTISLKGTGEMNLNRQINIRFYTMVGPDRLKIPILTSFIGLASRQLFLIHATGTIDKPNLRKEALPVINETLQQLFPELISPQSDSSRTAPTPRANLPKNRLLPR